MRTQEQSITAERERSGKRSGPKIQMSGTVGINERSAQREVAERERSGVSGLNQPLMPLKPAQSVGLLCTFQRRSVAQALGPVD